MSASKLIPTLTIHLCLQKNENGEPIDGALGICIDVSSDLLRAMLSDEPGPAKAVLGFLADDVASALAIFVSQHRHKISSRIEDIEAQRL